MKLSELIKELLSVYDQHQDVDVEIRIDDVIRSISIVYIDVETKKVTIDG